MYNFLKILMFAIKIGSVWELSSVPQLFKSAGMRAVCDEYIAFIFVFAFFYLKQIYLYLYSPFFVNLNIFLFVKTILNQI